jgi:4-hydroxybutyrate CoA-transferase
MKDWGDQYNKKTVSKEVAISKVMSKNRVVVGHAAGEPMVLLEELVKQKERLQDVEIVHMVALSECKYCLPGMPFEKEEQIIHPYFSQKFLGFSRKEYYLLI